MSGCLQIVRTGLMVPADRPPESVSGVNPHSLAHTARFTPDS